MLNGDFLGSEMKSRKHKDLKSTSLVVPRNTTGEAKSNHCFLIFHKISCFSLKFAFFLFECG